MKRQFLNVSSLIFAHLWMGNLSLGYLKVEDINLPEGVPPEVGALGFDSDGTLYVATRRNDIFTAKPTTDPQKFKWSLFASGFHNACGMEVFSPGHLIVTQMAEVTEVKDTDGDGQADSYRNLNAEIGLSGNYHETNALCSDGAGGYYIAAGTASHNGPTFWKTQGEYSQEGRRGRNYSAVKWKGWVMHLNANTGELTPFASGFRMHNGIYRDSQGRLWCGDNQGDYRAATPLYLVKEGHFYGHPSSLVWEEKFKDQKPLDFSQDKLDELRTPATVLIPHAEMNRSASEPIEIPEEFGAFPGQLLVPDNAGKRITRIMLEDIEGTLQGSCTHFINGGGMRSGNNRVEWSPDKKQLYVGQTVRGWGKLAEGVQRLTLAEKPFDVEKLRLTPNGFELTYTKPLGELSKVKIDVHSFHYKDTHKYGGGQLDRKRIGIHHLIKEEKNRIDFRLNTLEAQKVYEIKITGLTSTAGETPYNDTYYYTAHVLAK